MANLDRIVDVQISLNTSGVTVPSFSDMIIVGPHALSVNRMLAITGADQLKDMGMPETDPIYKAARDAFKPERKVSKVYIGRKQVDRATLFIAKASDADYKVKLSWRNEAGDTEGVEVVTRGLSTQTTTEIATALAAAITSEETNVTVTTEAGVINIVPKSEGDDFAVTASKNILIDGITSTESWGDALSSIKAEGGSWYGIVITSRVADEVMAVADWAESNEKLFVTASADKKIIDGGADNDIASKLKDKNYFRTAAIYHSKAAEEYADASIMSYAFSYYPGAETWANKKLAGISSDALQEGQAIVAHGKNAMTYEPFNQDFSLTQGGKVAGGEWIDIIRFRDWLKYTMQADVVFAMINTGLKGKRSYTDEDIQVIAAAMLPSLETGRDRGGIAPEEIDSSRQVIPSWVISVPLAANVSPNVKASRVLQDVNFTARLAGAIHAVEIKGSLGYAL